MTAHQTKFFKRKEVSFPILLWIFGVSTLLVLHLFGVFSHAAPITDDDKVTVDGVENVGQYLTSLVLHAPSSSQLITIQYDKTLDALRVNGRINADALVIDAGQKDNNSSVQGNALFWWMGNSVDGKTSNNLIVGGENNSIKNFVNGNDRDIQGKNSVVIGSTNSEIRTSDNVLNIGTMNSSFSNKTKNVAAIWGQVIAQNAENSVALWAGKKTLASNAMLLGKSINAGGKNQIFVWSDTDAEFRPEQSSAFYVNTTNGFGLNTTTPRTKLDLANAGALKIAKTQPKHCSQSLAGITSYAGDVFCGCNGKEWIPLTSDMTPEKIAACKNLGKENCVGEVNTNANKWAPSAYPRWNHELDQWEPIGWKYSSKDPNTLGDCEYNCKLWFHPGANDPEGWLQLWACKACSEVMNKFRWKTAGTGDDNCDFTCKASFKYANEGKGKQSCSDCELGTYTENDNQDKTCKACDKPAKLWRDKPGLDPYFSGFTTKGDGANACDFDCAPRYQHFFNGKKSDKDKVSIGLNETVNGNACIFCKVGTWSAGGKNVCANCTNKPEQIEYSVNNVKYSLSNFSSYTSNGSTNDCEWKCDASKGLEKNGNLCKCRSNEHLEWGKCIANSMKAHCTNPAPANDEGVIKGKSDYDRQWIGDRNRGSRSVTHSWTYRENVSSPGICQWSCKTGYERSGNTCVKKAVPVNGACAQNVTVPIDGTKLVDYAQANSWLFCSPGTLVGPVISKGKLEWKCKGVNGWATSPTCRVSCPVNYTLQNGACVKLSTQYEWKCLKVEWERGYCSLPGENPNPFGPLGGSHSGGDSTAHKWCFFATKEACEKSGKCQWYSGGDAPSFTGEIPSCVDKSAPDDRTKDSENPEIDCKDPIPDCNKWTQIEYERYCKTIGKPASSQCVSENSTAKINGCFPTKDYDTLDNWVTCQSATTPWSCGNRCEWNNSWVWWKTYCSYLTKETCENAQKSTYYGCKWKNNTKKEIICREKWSGKEVPAKNCNWLLQPSCEPEKPISVYLQSRCDQGISNCIVNVVGFRLWNHIFDKKLSIQMHVSLPWIVDYSSDTYYWDLSSLLPELKRGDIIQVDEFQCSEVRPWNILKGKKSVTISTDKNISKQAVDIGYLSCFSRW